MTYIDASAIIGYLQKLQAPLFDQDLNGGRASIDGVLDQLLQSMNRGYNNLACCDLVDDILS